MVSDEGTEFLGTFAERLKDEKITVRRVNPEKQDHKILAPLNGICKYIRYQIFKRLIQIDKDS